MGSQFDHYNVKRNRAVRLLAECAGNISDDKLSEVISEKKAKLEENRFVVSVFGHFSNGKSTFLNSLMGFDHEVLKEDDSPSTATITRLRYADASDEKCNKGDVIYKNQSVDRIKMDDLAKYVARNGEVDVEQTISEVILYVNSPFLKNGVEIVDTPGFNSTYEIHSEIALQQVERSDAAIFLFSVEQPGNGEELDFLKRVRGYMNRVFFVLNKVDQSNDNGETEKNDIFKKMSKVGIDAENKRMYMLSAIRAREALSENDEGKLNVSGLKVFENALADYLTGEEFVKDKLLSPLGSAYTLIECERDSVTAQIGACSKDRNELNTEIQNKKAEIKEREKELDNIKTGIASSVKSEIAAAKADVKALVKKVENAQIERLEKINSKFDIRLANFKDINGEAYIMFNTEWENIADNFEKRLLDVLDTSIDREEEFYRISEAIAAAIRSHLLLEEICIDDPEFDFSALSKLDEEIERAKEKYERAYSKVSNLYVRKEEKNTALSDIEKIKKDLEQLRNKKEKRIESLSMVQVEYGYEYQKYNAYVKRSKIGQFFLGDKCVERERRVEYKDDRAYKAAVEEIKKTEEELRNSSLDSERKINRIREGIDKQIDREIVRAEVEEQASLDELMRKQEDQREEKRAMEKEIITVEKGKYLRELKKNLNDMGKSVSSFLEQSQKNFVSILSSCLEHEYETIEREKNSIEKMVSINAQTPEELDKIIVGLNQEKVSLTECMKKIKSEKETI